MSNAMQITMPKNIFFGKKFLLKVLILFLITIPQESYGFGFHFGSYESNNQVDNVAKSQQAAKKSKFKFRKIERIFTDDTNRNDVQKGGTVADGDNEGQQQSTDSEELEFEIIRKAKQVRQVKKPSRDEKTTPAWYILLYEKLFSRFYAGISKEIKTIDTKNIISWLKWMSEKSRQFTSNENVSKEISFIKSWTNYLDRWPFNILFTFGISQNKIQIPNKRFQKQEKIYISSETPEPMSQANFEASLQTLPAFVLQPSSVVDIECQRQLQIFHRQLRGNKLWTLQMLDANGKISSGILHGNINQIGDFELCTQVKTLIKVTQDMHMRIRGKYCLAHIDFHTEYAELKIPLNLIHGHALWNSHLENPSHFLPRYTVANLGICVPHLCSANEVARMVKENLKTYNTTGVQFHVDLDDDIDCYVYKSQKYFKLLQSNKNFFFTICMLGALLGLVLTALVRENWNTMSRCIHVGITKLSNVLSEHKGSTDKETKQKEQFIKETVEPITDNMDSMENTSPHKTADTHTYPSTKIISFEELCLAILQSFSPRSTLKTLISIDRVDLEFPMFHVCKIGATIMLYICLKFLMVGHIPIYNRDTLVRTFGNPFSIIFRAPLIYTDTLLMISGFLSAYKLAEEMQEKKSIHVLKCFVAKMIRYLPTIFIVLAFHTWVQPEIGSGPLWKNLIGKNAQICEQEIWRNFFSLQNTIDMENTCSPMSIQLALEMQLYILAPLIVWLYFTDSDAGFFVYGALQAMSVAMRFSRTNDEHLSIVFFHGMNVSKFYSSANMLFLSPITRATTYLLGIGAGMLYRNQGGMLKIPKESIPAGWVFVFLSIIWIFWWPSSVVKSDFIYSSADAASYAAWSPLILGLCLFWLIFMFPHIENSFFKYVTFSRPFYIFSRITYPLQLVMYVIVLHNTASIKDSHKFSSQDLINANEILVIILFGILLAFIIDVPIRNVRRIIVAILFREQCHNGDVDIPLSGAEVLKTDNTSELQTEAVFDENSEPTESIWASESEEEEQKLFYKRRGSAYELSAHEMDVKEEEEEEEVVGRASKNEKDD